MKLSRTTIRLLPLALAFVTVACAQNAGKCDPGLCQIPDCNCGGSTIPGNMTKEEIPQLVLLTFDDAVNERNVAFYNRLFNNRFNPNGCPIKSTFYVSHEWTDYGAVHDLYAAGHEIASHSVTHSHGTGFSEERWANEIIGQGEMLVRYAGVDPKDIKGMRAPFLATGGDTMMRMLPKHKFTYDSSLPIWDATSKQTPPSWPYTLDHAMPHKCVIQPCPVQSHPGLWEIPMTSQTDERGIKCSMSDACVYPDSPDGVQRVFTRNFLNYYTKTKTPFPMFVHAAWFLGNQNRETGFFNFVDSILKLPDVYFVTSQEVLEFTRFPETLATIHKSPKFGCEKTKARTAGCRRLVCHPPHNGGPRRFTTCRSQCPNVYPWLYNFRGQ